MPTDLIRYDLLVQGALKSVVRKVLSDAARDGLPGDHHFYVSFRTGHAGVRLSPRLRERYAQDMTIVLQHQFDNLSVGETSFEVGLSFSGIPERLRVPFDALSGFFDPSVQFGLKFEASESGAEDEAAEASQDPAALPTRLGVPVLAGGLADEQPAAASGKSDGDRKSGSKRKPASVEVEDETDDEAAQSGAQVVSLDAFRKKS